MRLFGRQSAVHQLLSAFFRRPTSFVSVVPSYNFFYVGGRLLYLKQSLISLSSNARSSSDHRQTVYVCRWSVDIQVFRMLRERGKERGGLIFVGDNIFGLYLLFQLCVNLNLLGIFFYYWMDIFLNSYKTCLL